MVGKRLGYWSNPTQDENGKQLKQYTQWLGFNSRHKSKATAYQGVSVSDNMQDYDWYLDWAKDQKGWLNTELGKERIWSVDKDIVGDGLTYHEKHCVFVPAILNNFNKYTPTGELPRGVARYNDYYFAVVKMFRQPIRYPNRYSLEDSITDYYKGRLEYLGMLYKIYKDKVDDRVFDSLRDGIYLL